ncbi:MAG: phenylalanine--tRNA ligase subunit alpha [Alphaproteobacteria bacterium]|nr:phenylalanine--tRNA ligase subunit alpha [Alphaproteobacteria bacterium]OJV46461.1 MAG: phenylalanine--tRNA ligase subunit alpha [Alphaproteobacteria bacterium 43-37]
MSISNQTVQEYLSTIQAASQLDDLEKIRIELLGKNGILTNALKNLKDLANDERKSQGEHLNIIKNELSTTLQRRLEWLKNEELERNLQSQWVDTTLNHRNQPHGKLHPIHQTMDEVLSYFHNLGFESVEGPHIEDDYYNFTALNIPEIHPARQLMDTFYFPEKRDSRDILLRTHTSNVQIRALSQMKPPLRLVATGRVFRSDYDVTHTPTFHQMECIVIEPNTSMAHLKGCLKAFLQHFFSLDDVALRFRPSFFPFTEPSAEVDISCSRKDGKIILGQKDDWLEILGCGMIHPNVLANCGIDPSMHQGFAFGMGIERIAMLKYGISDLRSFYESDLRWLHHYGFQLLEAANLEPTPKSLFEGMQS